MKIDLRSIENARPTLLIGQDNCNLITSKEIRILKSHSAAVSRTDLGWCIHGPISKPQVYDSTVLCNMTYEIPPEINLMNESLDELIKEYFVLDSLGIKEHKYIDPNEQIALHILQSTSKRIDNGWETGLSWKDTNEFVPESRMQAEKRLLSTEKKLDRDPDYARLCYREMDHLFDLGYAKKLKNASLNTRHWYLPHFGVKNIYKPDKLRLVFDAAAKNSKISLNDQLLSGPDFLKPLLGILRSPT